MGGASLLMFMAWIAQAPGGLANLGDALNGTGKVAEVRPRAAGEARDIGAPADDKPHGDVKIPSAPPERTSAPRDEMPAGDDDPAETAHALFRGAEHNLEACRIEVARRRQVPPARVAAGAVTLRWTVQPDGHVRNAEALAATNTDLEVAACTKRVMSEWVFDKPKPGAAPVTEQATYRFP